jgi:ribosomal protein S18 acetylase RimI-like enzyme
VTTSDGLDVVIAPTVAEERAELYAAFRALVEANEGYPHDPNAPPSFDEFCDYWLTPATATAVARCATDSTLAGAYTMKPNGVGRAGHVANAGYFVVSRCRGRGLGEALVHHSIARAKANGFDAMQFNFVFETNPARRLYERLGFQVVGRVPEVIDGEAVYVYWRRL